MYFYMMRKYAVRVGVMVAILSCAAWAKKPDMIETYQEIRRQKSVPPMLISYKLYRDKGRWVAKDTMFEESRPVEARVSERFLEILEESGAGKETLQLKRFDTEGKAPLVCMVKSSYYGDFPGTSLIACVTKRKKRWLRAETLPKIDIGLFLTDDMRIKDLKVLRQLEADVAYRLEKDSDVLIVKKALNDASAKRVCAEGSDIRTDRRDAYLYYCKHLMGKLKEEIPFRFDSKAYRFVEMKKEAKAKEKVLDTQSLYLRMKRKEEALLKRYRHE